MSYLEDFRFWRDNSFFDEDLKNELFSLDETKDAKEIEDRFYRELEFGTAGLRGIMGAGTNRMNKYTVAKATAGYSIYLKEKFNDECLKNRGVVVCYDTRNNSRFFAEIVSRVFSSFGIMVRLFNSPRPIPVLSYSITKFRAVGGVMITASHNTKEYNGYKVYDETGCQLGIDESNAVTNCIKKIKRFEDVDYEGDLNLITEVDTTEEFVSKVVSMSNFDDKNAKKKFKIVYTPLYGTGLVPVTMALEKDGFSSVCVLEEQKEPNGDFPTVTSPNPGDKNALNLAIEKAKELKADIVIGTDPDSDRLGVAVFEKGDYVHLTGNQIGAILTDYILQGVDFSKVKKPCIIKSIVSSNFASLIAKSYGATSFETLTGFKFIGNLIQEFQNSKLEQKNKCDYDFLFGFEESYGFLTNTLVRDKDAVGSAVMLAECGAKLKSQGKTIVSRLNELYEKFGYCYDEQEDLTLKGIENLNKITEMMSMLRISNFSFGGEATVVDFLNNSSWENSLFKFPPSNVLMFKFKDDSFVAVRPSGTEPKIKFYYCILGKTKEDAKQKKQTYEKMLKEVIKI